MIFEHKRRVVFGAAIALAIIVVSLTPARAPAQSQTSAMEPSAGPTPKPAYEIDGTLIVRGLLIVHGPAYVANFIGVKFGTETIHGKLTEDSKKAPAQGKGHAKTIDGPLTVNGPLVVHGSLIVDGLIVDGPVTTGGGYQTL